MLKRKILAAVLPVVAAATVVGSGFSAWYFESGTDLTANTFVNVSVEGSTTSKGSLTFSWINSTKEEVDNAQLVLDQGDYVNKDDHTKGISFKTTGGTTEEVTGLKLTYTNDDFDKLGQAGLKANLEIKITISSDVNKYVTFVTALDNALDNGILPDGMSSKVTGNTAVLTMNGITTSDFTIDLSTGDDKINGLLRYYSVEEGLDPEDDIYGKPQSDPEYQAMSTALASKPTAITFDAKVTIK